MRTSTVRSHESYGAGLTESMSLTKSRDGFTGKTKVAPPRNPKLVQDDQTQLKG